MYKSGTHKITSCPRAFYVNLINKIQKIQIYAIIKNLTPTIQSSQKVKFELLIEPSLALKNPLISLLPSTPPANGIIFQIP